MRQLRVKLSDAAFASADTTSNLPHVGPQSGPGRAVQRQREKVQIALLAPTALFSASTTG
ncbi:hypothetical protein [Sphingomonas sp. R86521]|uniref:hypothetical protein n=1 Tax=Sphingomonas sp. R86521 TaxID=3093860 RepID=UPI0036D22C56